MPRGDRAVRQRGEMAGMVLHVAICGRLQNRLLGLHPEADRLRSPFCGSRPPKSGIGAQP